MMGTDPCVCGHHRGSHNKGWGSCAECSCCGFDHRTPVAQAATISGESAGERKPPVGVEVEAGRASGENRYFLLRSPRQFIEAANEDAERAARLLSEGRKQEAEEVLSFVRSFLRCALRLLKNGRGLDEVR